MGKSEDIETCYDDIHRMAYDQNTVYRIYVSLNSRDVVNATFQFQKKLVDITQGLAKGHPDALQMSKKVGSIWKTELEQRHARGTKRFLFDLDDNDEFMASDISEYLESKGNTKVHVCRKTVNGYAIVFDACDTRGLIRFCQAYGVHTDQNTLQKDSMLFVEMF